MLLEIQNFKAIKSKKLEFKNLFYLLKGASGCGKSTICEAIKFVLYNSSRNIKPLSGGGKTSVSLEYNSIKIIRSKSPEQLLVIKSGKEYLNNEGEKIITDLFNSQDIWSLSSYIAQNKRNIFLESSNLDKVQILKKIIFKDELENSQKFQNLLDKLIDKVTLNIKEHDKLIDYLTDKCDSFLEENNDIESYYKEALTYPDLDKNILDYKNNLENYYRYKEYLETDTSLEKLQDSLKNDYPENLSLDYINQWREYLKIKDSLSNFQTLENPPKSKNLNNEYLYAKLNLKIKEKFPKKDIVILRKNISQKIAFLNNQKLLKKVNDLKAYLSSLENTFLKLNSNWIDFLKSFDHEVVPFAERLSEAILKNYLSDNIQSFTCPHCQKCLYLKKDKLEPRPYIFSKNDKIKYRKLIRQMTELENNQKLAKNKINQILENYDPDLVDIDLDIDDNLLLETLDFLKDYRENIRNIEEIEKDLNYLDLSLKYKKYKKFISLEYKVPLDFDNYYQKYLKTSRLYNRYKNLDLDSLESFNPKDLERLENLQKAKLKYEPYLKDLLKLDSLKKEKKTFVGSLENSKKLKTIYNDTINQYLENNIQTINNKLNSILEKLFDNLNIYISFFKEVKGKEKATVNFVVVMDGVEYPNFNYFSGGEKDRISIALTLTFNIILGSPILIFDEVFSSLEEKKRESCLQAIKNFSPDKILINVCHETIEGYYDSIIEI